ncbi:hypothetical protein JQ604_24660 [Bradyrhizobium jicamae]|uniref:hypothetical protein n=1 Tax=Bradyrhizobium jicamae TaxID=280332 RepID=UPI001BAD5B67|nr:hypothetical protein [Bradyrhizobium jicamae]MBR0755386.1 hypothetical protein [Bradyrhizobium jicamae]
MSVVFSDAVAGSSASAARPSYPEMEKRVIGEIGLDDARETPFLDVVLDGSTTCLKLRFFADWEQSSAGTFRLLAHWALDIRDYTHKGARGWFIPRPLRPPKGRLLPGADAAPPYGRKNGLSFRLVLLDDPRTLGRSRRRPGDCCRAAGAAGAVARPG